MGDPAKVERAQLIELDAAFKDPAPNGLSVTVQFNPDTLKVTFANQTQQQKSAGDQRGPSPRQVVGAGASKLALQLWFDVSAPRASGANDVRKLTEKISYFMKPKSPAAGGRGGGKQPTPPGVRFQWGTFRFDGLMDALDETLDFFSPDGRPLRSNLSLSFSGQLEIVPPSGAGGDPAARAGPTPGTKPLTQAPAGSSLPGLAATAGLGANWQAIATANGVENPRLLSPGMLLDLNVQGGVGVSGGSAGFGISVSASVGTTG